MKLKKKYLSVIASVFVLGSALGVTSAAAEGTTEEGAVVSEVAEEAVGAATASKITSMKFEGAYPQLVFYRETNLSPMPTKGQYYLGNPWVRKSITITYADGKKETLRTYQKTRYDEEINIFIKYSGKKSLPEVGTYDVHFQLDKSGKEIILKNGAVVKSLSDMPVITGTGSQEVDVTDTTAYACLKTSGSTRYTLTWDPSFQFVSVYRLRNGKLEELKYVENGKICVLNPKHTYYIGTRLYSAVLDLDKIKFSAEEVGKIKSTMKIPTSSLKMNTNQSTQIQLVTGMEKRDHVESIKSSNSKIVKAEMAGQNGEVTLTTKNKTGKANITITLAGGAKKTIAVTVRRGTVKTTKISGIPKTINLKVNGRKILKPVLTPLTSQEPVTYTSSNEKVVSVFEGGVVEITGNKKGTAKITVKSGKKKAVVTVKVR